MIKKLLSDETGVVFPSELVLILALLACLSSIAWAIGGSPSDLEVIPGAATQNPPQAEIEIISDRTRAAESTARVNRVSPESLHRDSAETAADETDKIFNNLTICGKEDLGFTYYDD